MYLKLHINDETTAKLHHRVLHLSLDIDGDPITTGPVTKVVREAKKGNGKYWLLLDNDTMRAAVPILIENHRMSLDA